MASQQANRGSEASGKVQMKKEEYMNKVNEAATDVSSQAQATKDEYTNKASDAASRASDTAEGKKEEWMNKANDKSESAKDNSTVQAAQSYAIELKDQASTLLQQTGVQVKSMAAGAAEAVKSTLGMNNPSDNNTNTGHAAAAGAGAGSGSPLMNPHNPNQTSAGSYGRNA